MLSLKKGTPIARTHDGKFLRLCNEIDELDISKLDNKILRRFLRGNTPELKKAVLNKTPPIDEELLEQYNDILEGAWAYQKRNFKSKGKLQVLPSKDIVERLYISGPSNSGKSTFASRWISESKKLWKGKDKKDLVLFSRVADDKAFNKFKPITVDLDEEYLAEPVGMEELEDSICIFDDIDTLNNKYVRDEVIALRGDILECGRHMNIRILCTSHILMSGNKTKQLLNESTSVVLFPQGGNLYAITQYLKLYCGFVKGTIDKILKLKSRWVCIRKVYPMLVLHEFGCFLA
jgi:hypothetical protein